MKCEKPRTLKGGRVVPCGKCLACRASYSDEWIARFMCESKAFRRGAFFGTLTYNDEALPSDKCLNSKHVADYFKRVKKRLKLYDVGFRYTYCGEYGTNYGRPHYHFICCGMSDRDVTASDIQRFRKVLEDCWTEHQQGSFVYITEIRNAEASIRYLINYTNKTKGYWAVHAGESKKEFEERTGRIAPFVRYSHGISSSYIEENINKIDELDYLEFGGHKFAVPRYFRKKAELARSPRQVESVLEKVKSHIDETARQLWKHEPNSAFVIWRHRLDIIDIPELSEYLTSYRNFCAERAKLRARYRKKWKLSYLLSPPFTLDEVEDWSFKRYLAWCYDNDFEYLRDLSSIMQDNWFPVAWYEILEFWNECLLRIYATFEPLYRQRGLNKVAKIKNAMERRYVKSSQKNSAHD